MGSGAICGDGDNGGFHHSFNHLGKDGSDQWDEPFRLCCLHSCSFFSHSPSLFRLFPPQWQVYNHSLPFFSLLLLTSSSGRVYFILFFSEVYKKKFLLRSDFFFFACSCRKEQPIFTFSLFVRFFLLGLTGCVSLSLLSHALTLYLYVYICSIYQNRY